MEAAVRSQAAGRNDVVAALQRSVSCISPAVVIIGAADPPATFVCALGGRHVPLGGSRRLDFSMLHHFKVEPDENATRRWMAVTIGYHYHLLHEDGAEVIRFEWHRYGELVPFPHIHGHGQQPSSAISHRTHIPSGRVSLAAVVRFAIEELGVRPLRSEWRTILDEEG